MSNPFDIDRSPATPELLEIAKNELRETPENRAAGLKQLRELLKQNTDLNFKDDDEFLTVVLRCCHWYPESGLKLLKQIAQFRKEHEKILKGLLPENVKKPFVEGHCVNILIDKDHKGRRVLLMSQGQDWDPSVISQDEIFQLLYLMHIISQQEMSTQINGVVVIMDYEGLSLKQIKGMQSGSTKRLLTFIQEAMPIRLKEVHFVKQPFIFNMVWALVKPFVGEKLKNRMFFHGDDMTKLHKYIPAENLPKNYGGTLPEINYSGKEWYPCTENYKQHFIDWSTFGFK